MIDNWRAFMPYWNTCFAHISKNYRTKNCFIRMPSLWMNEITEYNTHQEYNTQYFLVRRSQRLATDILCSTIALFWNCLFFARRKKVNDFLIKRLFSHFFPLYRCTILHMQRKLRKHIAICMWMSCEDRTPSCQKSTVIIDLSEDKNTLDEIAIWNLNVFLQFKRAMHIHSSFYGLKFE